MAETRHLHPAADPAADEPPAASPPQQTLAKRGTVDGDQPVQIHQGRPVRKHWLQITGRIYLTADQAKKYVDDGETPVDITLTGTVIKEVWHRVKGKQTDENPDGIYYDHQLTFHGAEGADDPAE